LKAHSAQRDAADGSAVLYARQRPRHNSQQLTNRRRYRCIWPLAQPVPLTLTATSTFDAALVATINLFIF
jgi:hypothetical protein